MSWGFCGGVDFLKPFHYYILCDDFVGTLPAPGPARARHCHLRGKAAQGVYLTDCIYSLVSESQPPHKIVNVLLTTTSRNIKLTVLWESWLSKTNQWIHCLRQKLVRGPRGAGQRREDFTWKHFESVNLAQRILQHRTISISHIKPNV